MAANASDASGGETGGNGAGDGPGPSAPAKPVPSARADVALGVVVALGAALLMQQTLDWRPSAAIFPRLVAGLLFGLGLANALQGLRRLSTDPGDPFLPDARGFAWVWVAIVAYFIGVIVVGFALATVGLTVGLSWLFDFRKPLRAALAGAVFVALTLVVFGGLFGRPLPQGLVVEWIVG